MFDVQKKSVNPLICFPSIWLRQFRWGWSSRIFSPSQRKASRVSRPLWRISGVHFLKKVSMSTFPRTGSEGWVSTMWAPGVLLSLTSRTLDSWFPILLGTFLLEQPLWSISGWNVALGLQFGWCRYFNWWSWSVGAPVKSSMGAPPCNGSGWFEFWTW